MILKINFNKTAPESLIIIKKLLQLYHVKQFYILTIMNMAWWILLWVVVILGMWLVALYNNLITLQTNRENAFADIDVQLKLRFDLVPNIVNTVKGYAKHEKDTFKQIVEARTGFMNAKSIESKVAANNELNGALKTLFAVAENYPDLKANQNFINLQEELSDIENKLAASRRYFNSATKEYNIAIQTFPSVLIANTFWFKKAEFFELDEEEKKATKDAPKVEF